MSAHTIRLLTMQPIVSTHNTIRATWLPSCRCGWRASQPYPKHSRAVRAYYRHLRPQEVRS